MGGLNYTFVDLEELERSISQLKLAKDNLETQLKKIKGIIDSSVNNSEIFFSVGAEVTQKQFDEMYDKWAIKFDNYVQEYIDFFEKAKNTYATRDEHVAGDALKLNSFID